MITRRNLSLLAMFSLFNLRIGSSKAKAPLKTVTELRDLVLEEIQRQPKVLRAIIDPADPAKIICRAAGGEVTADVTNLFAYINAYPDEDVDALIQRFVRGIVTEIAVTDENLVFAIRNRDYIDFLESNGVKPLDEPLVGELVLVIMADMPNSMAPVETSYLSGRTMDELKRIAEQNVRRWLPKVVRDSSLESVSLYYIEENTLLSGSLILLEEFWKTAERIHGDDVIFILPRKDQLMLFDARDKDAIVNARLLVEAAFLDDLNLLSRQIFRRRNGKLELVAER